tara:strand:- start:328 stop:642 length:315 start_codon:yes stop_codon:yes gene_type:complete
MTPPPKNKRRAAIVDIVVVFFLMALGVTLSGQIMQAMKGGEGFEFSMPSWGKLVLGFVLAGVLIGGTDLLQGEFDGKTTTRARFRRYSHALQSGVFFRVLTEAT